jgi:integrase
MAGAARIIPLGPRARAILEPFLTPDPLAYLFSPRDVVTELRRLGKVGRSARSTAVRYDRRTYRQAIVRACRKAEIEPWSPLRLRHTAATAFRAEFGVEAAQAILGHSRVDSTQVYAERNARLASKIMAKIG